jgi:hypothetical protein
MKIGPVWMCQPTEKAGWRARQPHRLHAMAVGAASCERSGDIV